MAAGLTVSAWSAASYGVATTFCFNIGLFRLQSGGGAPISWTADTIKARLLDAGVVPLITDPNLSGYTGIGTDATLGTKSLQNDTATNRTKYLAANAVITSPAAAQTYGSVVVYLDGADDAHRIPLFCVAAPIGVTDGSDLSLVWDAAGVGHTQQ